MKRKYDAPNMEIELFEADDVVLSSNGNFNESEKDPFAIDSRSNDIFRL